MHLVGALTMTLCILFDLSIAFDGRLAVQRVAAKQRFFKEILEVNYLSSYCLTGFIE